VGGETVFCGVGDGGEEGADAEGGGECADEDGGGEEGGGEGEVVGHCGKWGWRRMGGICLEVGGGWGTMN
jgi:hypothetical protein